MCARAGAGPPPIVMLPKNAGPAAGIASWWIRRVRPHRRDARSRPRCARVARADALQDGVCAVAAGEFEYALDGFLAAFADDVGGAELARDPVGVAAHDDDLLGAEALGGDRRTVGAVADGDPVSGRDLGGHGRAVAPMTSSVSNEGSASFSPTGTG